MHEGSCLCGAVRFTVGSDLLPPTACHCTRCRKFTGHYEAGTDVPRSAVSIHGEDSITWYHSSDKVRRGFCSICGSSLFFDPLHLDRIGIFMGAFDTPTNTNLAMHIFVADKGDYYDIADGLPQNPQ
ncbi:aldehyde-activating protein [Devosia geojensis]|uniref:Aldehyde-activating protein n=1 Tax=Devosia geojensis TaxID=443610 RepID=A0A0F5FPU1_9HYPH|nr:GFA family protein [Devosia geojensis]KKB10575.1 aldehyde-activating protein [Devosia geojensis]